MEITPESDAQMCLNRCKYLCFRKVPPFQRISYLGVPRVGFGSHFERFLVTLGATLVIFEGTGRRPEFQ